MNVSHTMSTGVMNVSPSSTMSTMDTQSGRIPTDVTGALGKLMSSFTTSTSPTRRRETGITICIGDAPQSPHKTSPKPTLIGLVKRLSEIHDDYLMRRKQISNDYGLVVENSTINRWE